MKIRRVIGVVAGLVLAVGGAVGLSAPAWAALPIATPTTCAFQTFNTHNYLTAMGGGGRTTDVIRTTETHLLSWERFRIVDAGDGVHVGIKTANGNFLTAVDGGGRTSNVLVSTATVLQSWEKFTLVRVGGDGFAIQTFDGHYLTAVSGGGRSSDVIHSDATQIQAWELFIPTCGI
ncbi:hypothetical protein J5X84_44715 [Streptosporangiaceae bacterium NEAU-GS5]|nr:hypothetical protein [Streptosporangiaceae bacterium NEAU-GS5]